MKIYHLVPFCIAGFFIQQGIAQEKVKDSAKSEILDEVLVKAVRVNATSPLTHNNLSKKEIAKRNLGQDIPILMNFLPSVVTTSDAGAGIGYTGIRVRGVSSQSTNITINGIPYNDAESLGTFWVNLPDFSSSVENMQLQRGVGTSTNGSGAFGASINILTDAVSKNASGEIANSFGSYNSRKHTVKFSTGLLNEHIEIAGRFSKIYSDGYIDRASSDLKSYFLQGAYKSDNTLIKALAFGGHERTYQAWNGLEDLTILAENRRYNTAGEYTDANGQLQFYENEVDDYRQDHYQLHWNQRINNQWSTNIGLNYTHGEGYFEQFKEDDEFADYGFPDVVIGNETISSGDIIRRRWLDNDFYVATFSLNYKTNSLDWLTGASYGDYDGDHFGEIIWSQVAGAIEKGDHYYDGNGKKTDFSVFSKATYKVSNRISLYGDLQLRTVNYSTSGLTSDRVEMLIDQQHTFFNPKFGLTYLMNENNNLYLSYARANREPNRGDYEVNQDVKPEQLNDFELGWRHHQKAFKLNANLYYMLYNEQLVLTGALDDVGNPIRTNSGDSYRLGLELDAAIALSNKVSLQPNIAISQNKNKQTFAQIDGALVDLGKTNLSFSPELIAANALVVQPTKQLQLTFMSKYVGEQYMGNTDSDKSKLKDYFVNDLNIIYQIPMKNIFDSITFSALVNNIFDEEYIANGYYYTYDDTWSNPNQTTTIEGAGYYPQATRNFLLGVSLKF
ncbi:TonB-dependent receptor [Flavobacteriaceae bacterium F08102]|nr:TonB-dependent receptor [Flavobacteriaceae bacterium F08102]